jgi:hypothetical protein
VGSFESLTLSNALIREHVKMLELGMLLLQQLHDLPRKPAARYVRGALHEQDYLGLVHQTNETRTELFFGFFCLRLGRKRGWGGCRRRCGGRSRLERGLGKRRSRWRTRDGVLGERVSKLGSIRTADSIEKAMALE